MKKQAPVFRTADGQPGSAGASARVVVVYAVVVAGVTLPTPLYLYFQDRWSLTNAEVTGLYALYPVGVLAVLLGAGHWADQMGRRAVIGLALVFSALSSAAFLVASSAWMVAGARVLTGVASGFVVNAANALLVELAPVAHRRRASVVSTVVNQVGLGLGAVASAVLVEYAWSPSRLVFGCHLAAMAVAAGLLLLVPETVRQPRRPTLRLQSLGLPPERRTDFWAASLAAFAAFALCGLLAALAPAMVREQLRSDNALYSGGAVALVFVASAISQALWVRSPDVPALLIGSALLVVGLATMTVGLGRESVTAFFVGVTVGGAAVGALFMSSLALVNHAVADAHRASTTGTYFAIAFSGLILPVVGTGLAADHLTQLQATAVFGCVISAVTIASAALLLPARARHQR